MTQLDVYYRGFLDPTASANEFIYYKMHKELQIKYPDIIFKKHAPTPDFSCCPNQDSFVIINLENLNKIIYSLTDINVFMMSNDFSRQFNPETIKKAYLCNEYNKIMDIQKNFKGADADNTIHYLENLTSHNKVKDVYFFENPDEIFSPINYGVRSILFDKIYADFGYESRKNILSAAHRENKLVFRGYVYGVRELLMNIIKHPQIEIHSQTVDPVLYIKEMLNSRCVLSLNGRGEICNRDIEAMALGIPVIRPKIKICKFKDELIPDYHYVSFDYPRDSMLDGEGTPEGGNISLLARSLVSRWEEVKNDIEFLDFVSENARRWFDENARCDTRVDHFIKDVDVYSLL